MLWIRTIWMTLALLLGLLLATTMALEPADGDPALDDAQLTDVVFVTRELGWAVGDRGVIWHTADGGQSWNPQHSGVTCQLHSVCFLDDKLGWAAGGFTKPYSHTTVGVVLHTRDGGQKWSILRDKILPTINQIGFFDAKHGWAVGHSSPLFPTGTMTTTDGGRSWTALGGGAARTWLAADFLDPNTGVLAGRDSSLALAGRNGIEPVAADYGLRTLHRLKLAANGAGWLVGDGGLVLNTVDAGRTWSTTEGALPAGANTQFDYSALAVRGRHVWIAGTPGTRVLHSADGGRTWESAPTRQSLPIRSLSFVDEQHGWAVGELGTILASRDGGRTWHKQRSHAARGAIAGFFARPEQLPLELMAKLSADEGYLSVMEVLNREESEIRSAAGRESIVHEAASAAGASAGLTAWQFPLRSAALKLSADRLIEDWNRVNDGQGIEKLEAHIVSRLRMWRPSIVVTAGADARDPLALAINQVVLSAVEQAGDPTRHAEQITAAGLEPWKVQKVYAALAGGVGTANINTAQVTARLGRSIGELSAPSRGLVAQEYTPAAPNVAFRLLVDHIPQGVGERDFFSGIAITPGGDARRMYQEGSQNNLAAAQREAQRFRNLQAILELADKRGEDGHFLANLGDQTRDLEPDRAAHVLFQLAKRYWAKGRADMAAECYEVLAERHANHPLAGAALTWLIQYYASGEAAHRAHAAGSFVTEQSQAHALVPASQRRAGQLPAAGSAQAVQLAGGVSAASNAMATGGLITDPFDAGQRTAKACGYAEQLEQVEPGLAYEPRVRFPLAAAQKQQGRSGAAERFFQALRHHRAQDAWWTCGQGELWLLKREGPSPKPIWYAAQAPGKPRLDAQLTEPFWRSANSIELHSAQRDDGNWSAVAMLAYDHEYLYLGLSVSRHAGYRYQKFEKPRPRDSELSDQDRVDLLIDVDRDYATYYQFTLDHTGRTAETCWHDATWNPEWFVASGGDETAWTAEAAIPLAALAAEPPSETTAWAVGVQRTVPGVGFQSWTQPASPGIMPEGFGYVVFEKQ